LIELDVPAIEVTVSVAVTVCIPSVFKVIEKLVLPFANAESAGNPAMLSLLAKCTRPEYPVTSLFQPSSAVTSSWKAVPELT